MNDRSNSVLQVVLLALLVLATASACTAPTPLPEATSVPTVPIATSVPIATATVTPTSEPTATQTSVPAAPTETPAASARYKLTFEATWSAVSHPLEFPPNPHFSGLIGATHRPTARLWAEGETATPGVKNMAETGAKSPLDSEIAVLIGNGEACELISGGGIGTSPGSVTVELEVTRECPLVSVVSMIAPSPDWFVGVAGLSLLDEGGWVEQIVLELRPYDAGTDSGDTYTSADEPTEDPEAIHRIEVEPFLIDGVVPGMGTFTFSRLGE